MSADVEGFQYGAVTPVVAYLMAFLGSALGLRCVVRSVYYRRGRKPGWLALGAASLGCGIWMMHFVAMMGFGISGASLTYDVRLTMISLVAAVVVVGFGVFTVGYLGAGRVVLSFAGSVTGLGVAAMHYLGMAALQVDGSIQYALPVVVLSVVIAVVAATAALWAAVSVRGFGAALAASLVMAVAVTGMHYTAMGAVSVHLHTAPGHLAGGTSAVSMLPMLAGPALFLLVATGVVLFDPLLILGEGDWDNGRVTPGATPPHRDSAAHPPTTEPRTRPDPYDRT
ncbi:MHYT domain-containing protein [Streptomyces sp. NPDC047028]|uniref:MHYT domain-containing protein n=1 Tax=Streptomyces sp. NPDC047028 TaxID=3155793 RepID=UPI0033E2C961